MCSSDLSDPLLINLDGGLSFDHTEELESLGSSLHRSNAFSIVAFDDSGVWVDAGEYIGLTHFRKLHTMTYTVSGGVPVNPMFRILEKTSEMTVYSEKFEPQVFIDNAVSELALFDPLVSVQKGSSIKFQIKSDAAGANGSSLKIDKIEYLDFTLEGF